MFVLCVALGLPGVLTSSEPAQTVRSASGIPFLPVLTFQWSGGFI